MITGLSGTTRLHCIIGDPIAQVRSPAGVTRAFAARGYDGILVPIQIAAADLSCFLVVATRIRNLDGIIATIPHKFACFQACASTTERARFLQAANLMHRRDDGRWHGDMVDGLGFLGAVQSKGFDPRGKRVLLVGAGGAGSAIALAFMEAGAREIAIHDEQAGRRDALIERLNGLGKGRAAIGTVDARGFDLVANATPETASLSPSTFCGCVITKPEVSPFIAAARQIGCVTVTGSDMYEHHQEIMVDFLLSRDCSTG